MRTARWVVCAALATLLLAAPQFAGAQAQFAGAQTASRRAAVIRRAVWESQFHSKADYVASSGRRSDVVAVDPRPIADKIEDILDTPALQNAYGGDHVNANGSVTVYVVPGGEGAIAAALSALGSAVIGQYTFVEVPNTWASLTADVAGVSYDFPANVAGNDWQVPVWYPDAASSSVVFETDGSVADARAALAAKYPNMPITVVPDQDGAQIGLGSDRYVDGVSGRVRGGDQVNVNSAGMACTDGFAVKGNASGVIFQTIAGHCLGNPGEAVVTDNGPTVGDISTNYLKSSQNDFETLSCFAAKTTCTGFVWIDPPSVTGGAAGTLDQVHGQCECDSGLVTFDGAVSGQQTDFNVTATGVCITESGTGDRACNLHQASSGSRVCSRPGDSGGPVYQRGDSSQPFTAFATGTIVSGNASGTVCDFESEQALLNTSNTSIVIGNGVGGPT